MTMSFTMNWKIMRPGEPVRFEVGEPLFQAIPLLSNPCADIEGALVTYKKLDDDPDVSRSYREWDQSRKRFMERSKAGELKPDEWQRDYFLGRDAAGQPSAPLHMTKVKPPRVGYEGTAAPPQAGNGASALVQPCSRMESQARQQPPDPVSDQVETRRGAPAGGQTGWHRTSREPELSRSFGRSTTNGAAGSPRT